MLKRLHSEVQIKRILKKENITQRKRDKLTRKAKNKRKIEVIEK